MLPEGVIISGFVSKIINDIVDISITKAKEAVESKNNKHINIESQIYSIIINVLKKVTTPRYDNEIDKIYDAAEKLLIDIKSNNNTIVKIIEENLGTLLFHVDDEKCEEFIRLLCHEIVSEDYNELYKEILLLHDRKESQKTFRIEQKVDNILQSINDIKIKKESSSIIPNKKFQNNKKERYIKIWNSRLFLHENNNEHRITLKDAFIMPRCEIVKDAKKMPFEMYSMLKMSFGFADEDIGFADEDIGFADEDIGFTCEITMDEIIQDFVKDNGVVSMLITGGPGIGKTSMVSWIANEFKNSDDLIILRFRDWQIEELNNRLLRTIYNTLKCTKADLENKILILDGFDELKSLKSCEFLLNDFFNDILDFDNLKIIITSRSNYINSDNFEYKYELLPFNIFEIQKYYQLIKGIKLEDNKITNNNLAVLGIPVVLYMAIMCDIDFTQETTKSELYNRIFSEKGGIFDKFSYNGNGYDNGSHLLRDKNNIKKFLIFLREVSFTMFEKDKLMLCGEEYQIPELSFYGSSVSILDFPIKYLFENSGTSIEFIHKSIYEYFVSEYIFSLINDAINTNQKYILSCVFGKLFKKKTLSLEILDFLKFKIINSNLSSKFDIASQTFQEMLEHGMTYYTGQCFENVIECEMNVFTNMLELLHLWDECRLNVNDFMYHFLQYNTKTGLNLKKVTMKNKDLSGVNLANANLSGANISYCIFKGANLDEINIDEAILTNLDLRSTKLSKVNFKSAIIKNVMLEDAIINKSIFSEKQMSYLEKYYNLQEDIVTTTDLFRTLNSIKVKYNIFNLDGTDGKVLSQKDIDMIIRAINREKRNI